jgi:hypothetical protein
VTAVQSAMSAPLGLEWYDCRESDIDTAKAKYNLDLIKSRSSSLPLSGFNGSQN